MTFQVGGALLDSCVLASLAQGDTYGYLLTQKIRSVFEVSESSLYPILRRLQKDGLLTAYDKPFQGRNRRYYSLTEAGRARLAESQAEWQSYRDKVNHILLGGVEI